MALYCAIDAGHLAGFSMVRHGRVLLCFIKLTSYIRSKVILSSTGLIEYLFESYWFLFF